MTKMNHKQRMQLKKEHIDSKIEAANIDKGVVVLITGNGKGKSSSAFGMVCRALGYSMKIGIVSNQELVNEKQVRIYFSNEQKIHKKFIWS